MPPQKTKAKKPSGHKSSGGQKPSGGQQSEPVKMPENFENIVRDFTADLSTTFPEYTYLWDYRIVGIEYVFEYCLKVYPERFFDILYQNDEIFLPGNPTNTAFLPNVEFKMLYSLPGVSDNTKQSIWKYLQLILMTIMTCVQNKSNFGETMNLFDGIDEADLQAKLSETMKELETFFQEASDREAAEGGAFGIGRAAEGTAAEGGETRPDGGNEWMPNADDLHSHLKGLFDGKIGTLAKELLEELSGDLVEEFSVGGTPQSTQDILKKLFRSPQKLMELLKKVGAKLQEKMKRGDISHDDLMREASEMMNKMKDMGGGNIQQMMKQFAKGMGGNVNMGALNKMMGQTQQKDRLRAKLEQKRAQQADTHVEPVEQNHFVFKVDGETQERSVRPPATTGVTQPASTASTDDWLDEPLVEKKKKSKKPQKK